MADNNSACCNKPTKVGGDDTEGTHYYICTGCNRPCDLAGWGNVNTEKGYVNSMSTADNNSGSEELRAGLEKLYNESRQMAMLRRGSPINHMVDGAMQLFSTHIEDKVREARIDENKTIHKWLQKPDGYDGMSALEQNTWVIMTLGKIGSYLDARQVELAAPNKEEGK